MPELDAVRGCAVLMVLAYHGVSWSNPFPGSGVWQRGIRELASFGWLGVDLFFVLSGLLITGVLLDDDAGTRGSYFRNFYLRRALRILPLYYLTLFTVSAVLLAFDGVSREFFLLSLAYLSNIATWLGATSDYPLTVLWSLAIEEQFYLVWPALIWFSSRRIGLILSVGLCVVVPVLRAVAFSHGTDVYYPTWLRVDGFAWGAVLAMVARSQKGTRRNFLRLGLAFLFFSLLLTMGFWEVGIGTRTTLVGAALQFTCADMFFAGLLALAMWLGSGPHARWASPDALRYFGRLSYCIYLVHQFLFWCFDRLLSVAGIGQPPPDPIDGFVWYVFRASAVAFACILVAEASWRWLESPLLTLKARWTTGTRFTAGSASFPPAQHASGQ